MKTTYRVVLVIILAMVFTGGCREQQATSDVRMHRLIAMENRELKEQLQQEKKKCEEQIEIIQKKMRAEIKKRDDEIQDLKTKFQNEKNKLNNDIESFAGQLEECVQMRDEKMAELMKKYCEDTVSQLMDWNTELAAENERLKMELAKIKDKIKEPKADTSKIGGE